MIWDGTVDSLNDIRKLHPSAKIYAMQTKMPDGSIVFDMYHGQPILVIEDKARLDTWKGWVFEIGEDIPAEIVDPDNVEILY